MGKSRNKIYSAVMVVLTGILFAWIQAELPVKAKEPVVIVIDPGHGGDNLGAEFEEYTEKDMNLIVAKAMKEELEQYDDVTVYMTHEDDISMSIKNRALYAKEVNADFLFCLHFNSSVNHNLYGAEVWVSAFGDYYVKGRQFAEISMELFEEMGLFSRGIKTRLNDEGDNYYGILRYCTGEGIPAALIEHCHLDNDIDKPFYQQNIEQLREFGRKDAEAVAKYFGLKSSVNGTDYSSYPKIDVPYCETVTPDKSKPEECRIEVIDIDKETGRATIAMYAKDSDSYIQYYCYSLDGGNTYSELLGWPRTAWNHSEPEYVFELELPFDKEIELRTSAYNGYDGFSESNIVMISAIASPVSSVQEESSVNNDSYRMITYEQKDAPPENIRDKMQLVILILLISILITIVLYATIRMLLRIWKHNKKR